MSSITKEIPVINKKGLHARPAALFVEEAKKYNTDIEVEFGGKKINGKSLLALMSLGVPRDGIVTVSVEGEEAEKTFARFAEILGENYD